MTVTPVSGSTPPVQSTGAQEKKSERKPEFNLIPQFGIFNDVPQDRNASDVLINGVRDVNAGVRLQDKPGLIDTQQIEMPRDASQIMPQNKGKIEKVTIPLFQDKPSGPDVRYKLKEIIVEGTAKSAEIIKAMRLQTGSEVREIDLKIAIARAFEMGIFKDVSVELIPTPSGDHKLLIKVKENPPLKDVKFKLPEGSKIVKAEEMAVFFNTYKDKTVNYNLLQIALQQINELYAKRGYPLSGAGGIELADDGTLTVDVQEDQVEDIVVEGNETTKAHVILRELRQKKGQPLNTIDLVKDLQRLFNYNYFESLYIEARPGSEPGKNKLVIGLEERVTGQAFLGLGWNSRNGIAAYVNVSKLNVAGTGHNASGEFNKSPLATTFDGTWSTPWLTDAAPRMSAAANVSRRIQPRAWDEKTNLYLVEDRIGASAAAGVPVFGEPFTTPWYATFGAGVGNIGALGEYNLLTKKFELDPSKTISGKDRDLVAQFNGSLSYDTRDQWFDPHSGSFVVGTVAPTVGDANNVKLTISASQYIPLTKKITLALNAKGGTVIGDTPFYTRFYSYGQDGLRGVTETGAVNGDSMAIARAEVRVPTPFNFLDAAAFADVGLFAKHGEQVTGDSVHGGVGVGARLKTGMGPIRFDFVPIDVKELVKNGKAQFGGVYMGLGHSF